MVITQRKCFVYLDETMLVIIRYIIYIIVQISVICCAGLQV